MHCATSGGINPEAILLLEETRKEYERRHLIVEIQRYFIPLGE